MRKTILLFIVVLITGCRSVDDWSEEQVLSDKTIELADKYVAIQLEYNNLSKDRVELSITDDLDDNELNNYLEIEKKIAVTSQKLANSWFNFYLELRQDPGFKRAYKGHFYFRKAIDSLTYSSEKKAEFSNISVKDSLLVNEINLLESEARLAIGEIVSYNSTNIETDKLYSQIKRLYKDMN